MFQGLLTVVISAEAALVFFRAGTKLGRAIAYQLVGESLLALGTLTFAVAAHTYWLDNWSTGLQSSIRFSMFLVSAVTTVHLRLRIARIMTTNEKDA